MKRFFILFMAVILSSFVLIGCGSDQNAETISQLQATVDDLQNQVGEYSALKTELDSANNSIAELQSQMDALTAEKEEMSSKLEILYKIEPVDETMYTIADADIYDVLIGAGEELYVLLRRPSEDDSNFDETLWEYGIVRYRPQK